MNAMDGSHHDIACLLFEEYGTEFVCSSVSSNTWYQCTGHRWEEIEEGVFLRERISSDIVSKFAKKGGVFFQEAAGVEKHEKSWHEKVKQVQKIIKAVEEKFDIELGIEDPEELISVAQLVELVEEAFI